MDCWKNQAFSLNIQMFFKHFNVNFTDQQNEITYNIMKNSYALFKKVYLSRCNGCVNASLKKIKLHKYKASSNYVRHIVMLSKFQRI